jgi:hypothetical protein
MIDIQAAKKSKRYVTKHGLNTLKKAVRALRGQTKPKKNGLTLSVSRSEFVGEKGTPDFGGTDRTRDTAAMVPGLVPSVRARRKSDN